MLEEKLTRSPASRSRASVKLLEASSRYTGGPQFCDRAFASYRLGQNRAVRTHIASSDLECVQLHIRVSMR